MWWERGILKDKKRRREIGRLRSVEMGMAWGGWASGNWLIIAMSTNISTLCCVNLPSPLSGFREWIKHGDCYRRADTFCLEKTHLGGHRASQVAPQ